MASFSSWLQRAAGWPCTSTQLCGCLFVFMFVSKHQQKHNQKGKIEITFWSFCGCKGSHPQAVHQFVLLTRFVVTALLCRFFCFTSKCAVLPPDQKTSGGAAGALISFDPDLLHSLEQKLACEGRVSFAVSVHVRLFARCCFCICITGR